MTREFADETWTAAVTGMGFDAGGGTTNVTLRVDINSRVSAESGRGGHRSGWDTLTLAEMPKTIDGGDACAIATRRSDARGSRPPCRWTCRRSSPRTNSTTISSLPWARSMGRACGWTSAGCRPTRILISPYGPTMAPAAAASGFRTGSRSPVESPTSSSRPTRTISPFNRP
jgi:hypothetical protein